MNWRWIEDFGLVRVSCNSQIVNQMKSPFSSTTISLQAWFLQIAMMGVCFAEAVVTFEKLQSSYQAALSDVVEKGEVEIKRLSDGYVSAVARLENEFQAAGKLDLLLKARQEREQFLKSGKPGADDTPEIARLTAILDQNQKQVRDKVSASVSELSGKYIEQLELLQAELTKSGKIDDAILVKAEVEKIRLPVDQAGKMAAGVPVNPSAPAGGDQFVPIPTIAPNPVAGNPFRDGNWPVTMALPQGNYRIEGSHQIKGEKGRQLLLAAGSSFAGTDKAQWMVGNSLVVAREVSFRDFTLRGDLGSVLHFENCTFDDMVIGKGGPWFGGNYMSRWQMRNCIVKGSFIEQWNINHSGVQIIGGQFERVEFPSIEYDAGQEPSEVARHEWATFSGVRFRKCTLPASVLSLTENCEFDDCRFVDDTKTLEFKTPVARVLYVTNCTDAQRNVPKNLTLEMKPLVERPAP